MRQPDVVLIHPPSVFDFRERAIFYGPISDVIPSSPVFEMYPIGFLTLAAYLRQHGYRVRIVNLALLMMRSRRFDPERFLRRLRPKLFGIDLHWLPHAHGGPAVATLLKRIHPEIPIVFGGISATYFHRELVADPAVDFVLRGAVTEPSLLALVREIGRHGRQRWLPKAPSGLSSEGLSTQVPGSFESVPGLTWKDASGIRTNPATTAPQSLDDYGPDLGMMVSSVVRHLDFWTSVPFHTWWRHPITAVFTVRGCARACVTCGASQPAFRRFMPGHFPMLRSPEKVAEQVRELAQMTRAPIFLVGDLRNGGERYVRDVLAAFARRPVSNRIVFEFFDPPDEDLIAAIDASVGCWGAELSPESHDEGVRAHLGKARFTNARMTASIETMMASRCEQLDLFFMIGLPGQTYGGVLETVGAIERLFVRFDRRLSAFITPMGPFLDPGSDGFENAEKHGYTLRARTLAEHRALLEQNDWESILNYETRWMTRTEIVDATYDAAERLNELKVRHGRIGEAQAAGVRKRLAAARTIRGKLSQSGELDPAEIRAYSEGSINDKAELFAPAAFLRNFRIGGILRLFAREGITWLRRSASTSSDCKGVRKPRAFFHAAHRRG